MGTVDFLTSEVLRLVGETRGKKVLELGLTSNPLAAILHGRGAVPILVEESREKVDSLRSGKQFREFKFEIRQSELADLAFCPAESIDLALSMIALSGVENLARVFRQLERVLKDQAYLIFGMVHPLVFMSFGNSQGSAPARYRSSTPVDSGSLGIDFPVPLPEILRPVPFGETFSLLKRAGLAVEQILELPEWSPDGNPCDPTVLLVKARK